MKKDQKDHGTYYEEHREKRLAYAREYKKRNPEKIKKLQRKQYLKNRNKILAALKKWREENPEEGKRRSKKARAKYLAKYPKYQKEYQKEYRAKNREMLNRKAREKYHRNKGDKNGRTDS